MKNIETECVGRQVELDVQEYCTGMYEYAGFLDWIWAPIVITYYLSLVAYKKCERLTAQLEQHQEKGLDFAGVSIGRHKSLAFVSSAGQCLLILNELAPMLLMMAGVLRLVVALWAA